MDRVSRDVVHIMHYCLSTGNSEIALRFILLNIINTLMYIFVSSLNLPSNTGAQWLSGRVLDSETEGRQVRASPASLCCVLEQEH